MQAVVGDRLHVHGNAVGQADKTGEIVEVHGARARRRTWSGSTTGTPAVLPGPDAVVEHGQARAASSRKARPGPQEVGPAPGARPPGAEGPHTGAGPGAPPGASVARRRLARNSR